VSISSPGPAGLSKACPHADDLEQSPQKRVGMTLLGSIRVRLAVIVLIAAIPLMMLSATIVWQNYQLALSVTSQATERLRESAIARHVSAIAGAQQMMQALAQLADLTSGDPTACDSRLAGVLSLQLTRYTNLLVVNPQGAVICSAMPMTTALRARSPGLVSPVLRLARSKSGFALGSVRSSLLTGLPIIPAAYPILHGGVIDGFIYVGLRLDWFFNPAGLAIPALPALWIADVAGHVTQVAGEGIIGLPSAAILRRLQAGALVIDAASADGQPNCYASMPLGDDYTLIVAHPALKDRQAARGVLFRRIAQLGVLLLLGLAAVAIGVHIALCKPLTLLNRAVAEWRSSGSFDAMHLGDPPNEVRSLAASFTAAVVTLNEQEAKLRLGTEQQELLMREIHHRVKNNLQIVASLLNLQASRIRVPEAKAEFASARDRVRALATLHRHLYSHGEVHTINMPDFLVELCGQLFQAMGEVEGQRIKLTIEASPLQMSSDQAVPLSLIVTEAVSNALKYAFPGGRTGHVLVRLTAQEGLATLVVEDDGIGMPAGISESEHGVRDGIGITLIRGFARQIAAELDVDETSGTRYTLKMTLRHDVSENEIAA
jgi:two-component sensor histidine kinase